MHNILLFQHPVQVLKCVALHLIQKWSRYACWKVRFYTYNPVSPPRGSSGVFSPSTTTELNVGRVVLESYACSDARATDGLQDSEGTYRYYDGEHDWVLRHNNSLNLNLSIRCNHFSSCKFR